MVIKMHRELITIGPITIYWYSVIIITAIVIGIYFSSKKAEKNGLEKDFLLDLIFYLIPVGVLGARIYYVIFKITKNCLQYRRYKVPDHSSRIDAECAQHGKRERRCRSI